MATSKKTSINTLDHLNGVLQKFWIVGDPLTDEDVKRCLNYIGDGDPFHLYDSKNDRNEHVTNRGYGPPKYFTDFAEARACAAYWNEKIPWKYDPNRLARRHGMRCAFKPHLVKVVFA